MTCFVQFGLIWPIIRGWKQQPRGKQCRLNLKQHLRPRSSSALYFVVVFAVCATRQKQFRWSQDRRSRVEEFNPRLLWAQRQSIKSCRSFGIEEIASFTKSMVLHREIQNRFDFWCMRNTLNKINFYMAIMMTKLLRIFKVLISNTCTEMFTYAVQ